MVLEIHFSVPSLEISMGIKDTDTWKFSGALKISRTWKNPGPLEISRTPGNFQASWKFQGGYLISHWTSGAERLLRGLTWAPRPATEGPRGPRVGPFSRLT